MRLSPCYIGLSQEYNILLILLTSFVHVKTFLVWVHTLYTTLCTLLISLMWVFSKGIWGFYKLGVVILQISFKHANKTMITGVGGISVCVVGGTYL